MSVKLPTAYYRQLANGEAVILQRKGRPDKTLTFEAVCHGAKRGGKLINLAPLVEQIKETAQEKFSTEIKSWKDHRLHLDEARDVSLGQLKMIHRDAYAKQIPKYKVTTAKEEIKAAYDKAIKDYRSVKSVQLERLGWSNDKKVEKYISALKIPEGTTWEKFVLDNKLSFADFKAEQKIDYRALLKTTKEQLAQTQADLEKATQKVSSKAKKINQLDESLTKKTAELDALLAKNFPRQIERLNSEKQEAQSQITRKRKDLEALEAHKNEIQKELRGALAQVQALNVQLQKEKDSGQEQAARIEREIDQLKLDKANIQAQLDQAKQALRQFSLKAKDSSEQIPKLQAELAKAALEKDQIVTDKASLEQQLSEALALSKESAEKLLKAQETVEKLSKSLKELERKLETATDEIEKAKPLPDQINDLEAANTKLQAELEKTTQELNEAAQRFNELNAAHNALLRQSEIDKKAIAKLQRPTNTPKKPKREKGTQKQQAEARRKLRLHVQNLEAQVKALETALGPERLPVTPESLKNLNTRFTEALKETQRNVAEVQQNFPPAPPMPPNGPKAASKTSAKIGKPSRIFPVFPDSDLMEGVEPLLMEYYEAFAGSQGKSWSELENEKTEFSESRTFLFKEIPKCLTKADDPTPKDDNTQGLQASISEAITRRRGTLIPEAQKREELDAKRALKDQMLNKIKKAMEWGTTQITLCKSINEGCKNFLKQLEECPGEVVSQSALENAFNRPSTVSGIQSMLFSNISPEEAKDRIENKVAQIERTLNFFQKLKPLLEKQIDTVVNDFLDYENKLNVQAEISDNELDTEGWSSEEE